jgi:peptidoglycan/xylan/chitin deacetylase (PgdA/CDA1 family)
MAKILMYHGVDLLQNVHFNGRFISQSNFEKHIQFLKNNYNIITVEQAFEHDFINDEKSVCITFDDGYENNLDYLFPLVTAYDVPVAIYVTAVGSMEIPILWADLVDIATTKLPAAFHAYSTTFYKDENGRFSALKRFIKQCPIGGTDKFKKLYDGIFSQIPNFMQEADHDDYWKLLNDDQIKILSENKLVTIGSHGYWHNNLSNLPFDVATKEIDQSLTYLEKLTGRKVETLAFPDGSYNTALVNYCIEKGIKQILGSHYQFCEESPQSVLQHRIGIYAYDDIESLHAKLNTL